MNQILPGLYIGSIRDSKDHEQLKANLITHILSIHDTAKCGTFQGVQYLCICAADSPHQNLTKFFPQCNDFIHNARLAGGSVLIHCLAGMSRSVTIVAAYLMSITTLNYKEALDVIRCARSISEPNPGFCKQLLDFETYRLKQERNRLYFAFAKQIPNQTDEQVLRQLLVQQGRCRSRGSPSPQSSVDSGTGGPTRSLLSQHAVSRDNLIMLGSPKLATRRRLNSTSSLTKYF